MGDENAFLRAISAAPADNTVRLVYADWLEEQNDLRAEFVRLQVRLRELPPDDADQSRLQARERKLRADYSPYWLAVLDPPVWCVVGNIVNVRRSAVGETPRHGTRLFRPNAKIYLATRSHWYALLDPDGNRLERVEVVGQHRKSREWIGSWVSVAATTNWRLRLVHHPGALVRLREAGWPGFWLRPNEFQYPADKESVNALRAFFEAVNATVRGSG